MPASVSLPENWTHQLRENLNRQQDRVHTACQRAGRDPSEVTLVGVTKKVSIAVAQELVRLGIHDLGENRPQELWDKAQALAHHVRWHQIGTLQRNKVRRTLPFLHMMHALDRLSLAQEMQAEQLKRQPPPHPLPVLLQVNITGEGSKHGFTPDELPKVLTQLAECQLLQVQGLMTMARWEADPQQCRPTFAQLRKCQESLTPTFASLKYLSMGMSNDFDIAIEEGATHVRLGTCLFENILPPAR